MLKKVKKILTINKECEKLKEKNILLKNDNNKINEELNVLKAKFSEIKLELSKKDDEISQLKSIETNNDKEYSLLFKYAPNPYIITDSELNIIDYNREAYLKFEINDNKETPLISLMHKESFFDLIQSKFMEKDSSFSKIIVKMKERNNLTVRYNLSVRKNPDSLNTYLLILIDTEEEIKYKEKLEKQIEEQIEEIKYQHDIYLQNSKMASLGEMIALIAHQWRQPLSVISLYLGELEMKTMRNSVDVEDDKKIFKNIYTTLNYLSNTIDKFRNYINKNKKYKDNNLKEDIQEVCDLVSFSLKEKNIILEVENNLEVDYYGPESDLEEVLINIIQNAKDQLLKKDDDEEKWIKIKTYRENDRNVITIEDSGYGIPEDFLSKIFEPYFTTKHQSQGTGLGLNLCHNIITNSLKGNLTAKNTVNGALFKIELPLEINNSKKKILYVEDDNITASGLKTILEIKNLDIEHHNNPENVLSRIEVENFDVVILDRWLPNIDGLKLLKMIRKIKDIPIIMVSADKDTEKEINKLDFENVFFLSKPVKMNNLNNLLDKFI